MAAIDTVITRSYSKVIPRLGKKKHETLTAKNTVNWRQSKGENNNPSKEEIEIRKRKAKTKESRERAMMKIRERKAMKANSNLLTKYRM